MYVIFYVVSGHCYADQFQTLRSAAKRFAWVRGQYRDAWVEVY